MSLLLSTGSSLPSSTFVSKRTLYTTVRTFRLSFHNFSFSTGIPEDLKAESLEEKLQGTTCHACAIMWCHLAEMCLKDLNLLEDNGLITIQEGFILSPTGEHVYFAQLFLMIFSLFQRLERWWLATVLRSSQWSCSLVWKEWRSLETWYCWRDVLLLHSLSLLQGWYAVKVSWVWRHPPESEWEENLEHSKQRQDQADRQVKQRPVTHAYCTVIYRFPMPGKIKSTDMKVNW